MEYTVGGVPGEALAVNIGGYAYVGRGSPSFPGAAPGDVVGINPNDDADSPVDEHGRRKQWMCTPACLYMWSGRTINSGEANKCAACGRPPLGSCFLPNRCLPPGTRAQAWWSMADAVLGKPVPPEE